MCIAAWFAILSFTIVGTALCSADISGTSFVDLEENARDFVLESKQIYINEYPTAYNPTIVRWDGSLLMAFMIRHGTTGAVNGVGIVRLDDNFDVCSQVYELEAPLCKSQASSLLYDPRLIVIRDHLYMIYNTIIFSETCKDVRRMFVAEVHFDGTRFYTDMPEGIFNFDGERESRWEKNWMPFDYHGELHFVYSLTPHRILKPVLGTNFSESIATTNGKIDWKWGYPRGGTQAYPCDGKYLAFFHSSLSMPTVHSKGVNFPHYFFGAYVFSLEPPFEITHISPEPIIGKGFYSGPPYKTWRPLRVVFPDGFVFDEEFIWILCGKQDHEIWVVKLDRKGLLDSLVPVDCVTKPS